MRLDMERGAKSPRVTGGSEEPRRRGVSRMDESNEDARTQIGLRRPRVFLESNIGNEFRRSQTPARSCIRISGDNRRQTTRRYTQESCEAASRAFKRLLNLSLDSDLRLFSRMVGNPSDVLTSPTTRDKFAERYVRPNRTGLTRSTRRCPVDDACRAIFRNSRRAISRSVKY